MIHKLFYRVSTRDEKLKGMGNHDTHKSSTGGMYFDTSTAFNGQPLLLPEESCLAEDEDATLKVECEREGFNLFRRGHPSVYTTKAKAYLTNLRLIFVPTPSENQKYTSTSICIQAIREPRVETVNFVESRMFLELGVSLTHGASTAHPATCKTVEDFFEPTDEALNSHEYRNCNIICAFSKPSRAKLFLKGINLLLSEGKACPTRRCRFVEYEDLPLYCPAAPEPSTFDLPSEKLPLYVD